MHRMFQATVILFVMIASFIMLYAIFADPIDYITDLFLTIDSGVTAEIEDPMNFIKWIFGATVIFGILGAMGVYAIYAHKKEYEQ